jgi:hypothetical protein
MSMVCARAQFSSNPVVKSALSATAANRISLPLDFVVSVLLNTLIDSVRARK